MPSTGKVAKLQWRARKEFGYFCHEGAGGHFLRRPRGKLACPPKPRHRLASLLDFGKEHLQTLAPEVFMFGQPDSEQAQKTKSVVHTQRRFTLRALVRLIRDLWDQIGEAIEDH